MVDDMAATSRDIASDVLWRKPVLWRAARRATSLAMWWECLHIVDDVSATSRDIASDVVWRRPVLQGVPCRAHR